MAGESKRVVPRYRAKAESFNREIGMEEMMVTTQRDHGLRVFDAIGKGYDQSPGFAVKNGERVLLDQAVPGTAKGVETIGDLMEDAEFDYQALDCTNPNCMAKEKVQPLSQEMVDWQCSECSANYEMKGN